MIVYSIEDEEHFFTTPTEDSWRSAYKRQSPYHVGRIFLTLIGQGVTNENKLIIAKLILSGPAKSDCVEGEVLGVGGD